jgi:hypothetical protein
MYMIHKPNAHAKTVGFAWEVSCSPCRIKPTNYGTDPEKTSMLTSNIFTAKLH